MRLWLRANPLAILVCAYCVTVLSFYLYFGVLFQSLVGVISLALIPILFYVGSIRLNLKTWVLFLVLMLSYEALYGITPNLIVSRGIFSIYPVDKMLWGVNLTGQIQSFFNSDLLTDAATIIYSMQFVFVAIVALTLWFTSRSDFKRYAYALAMTSYFCLAIFLLVPTSPPWYSGEAQDLLQKSSPSTLINTIDGATLSFVSDKFAAFPSMHAACAVLFGFFMTRAKRIFALFSIPITAGILFSTLYLGQHFLVDLIGGGLVAAASILISMRLVKDSRTASVAKNMETPIYNKLCVD